MVNQMHIPFNIYRDTTEIEKFHALRILFLISRSRKLTFQQDKTTNRTEFGANTGSEQNSKERFNIPTLHHKIFYVMSSAWNGCKNQSLNISNAQFGCFF